MAQANLALEKVSRRMEKLPSGTKYMDARGERVSFDRVRAMVDDLGVYRHSFSRPLLTAEDPAPSARRHGAQERISPVMSGVMKLLPLQYVFENVTARRYCSGSNVEETIKEIRRLQLVYPLYNGIINSASEHTETLEGVRKNMRAYTRAIDSLANSLLPANGSGHLKSISIKPSQFGTFVLKEELATLEGLPADLWLARFLLAFNNMQCLVDYAKKKGVFVQIDMEDHRLTTFTAFVLYLALREEFENVGVVFQANLKRTTTDLDLIFRLMPELEHFLRSCKGVYYDKDFGVYVPMAGLEEPGAREANARVRAESFDNLNSFVISAPKRYGVKVTLACASMDLECQRRALFAFMKQGENGLSFRMQVLKGCYEARYRRGEPDSIEAMARRNGLPLDIYLISGDRVYGDDIFAYTARRVQKNPIVQEAMKKERHSEGEGDNTSLEEYLRNVLLPNALMPIMMAIYNRFYNGQKANDPLPKTL